MIRQLRETDRERCQELLFEKPAENLFMIGDIENFGFDQDFQKLWGDFTEDGRLKAVLLKYHSNYIAYSNTVFSGREFAEIINQDPEFTELSGLKSITEHILPYLENKQPRTRTLYYAKCEKSDFLNTDLPLEQVSLAGIEDIPAIDDLYNLISEFEKNNRRKESMKRGMESGSARTYLLKNGNEVLSSASTTAENSLSAMVIGVCTHPNHIKKGYASLCMTKLCLDLLQEGKMLCLFYDNPEAGRIYKRLGFEDTGMWMMHNFQPALHNTPS
ncbi:GNAT family N-acetyltransferase [Halobacillus salinarum]|uniref:GNAT family N-acetyltransferase n=1 Tax=Halobacillus salinarum TaxID=2932257 RepID=A0ABY4EGS5_9BACI|nr:GNAT family N-acetyltransferase [Halobacillus salinarum]UOQ43673.1 GNAT family N-acetyltransferase [Halobacillus salinarum]